MKETALETAQLRGIVLQPSPFLKWAGGKSQLLNQFASFLPTAFRTYFEPFLGGGAVFFHLVSEGRIRKAIISDSNTDLIDCYLAVRDDFDELLRRLKELQKHATDRQFYYHVARERFNQIKLNGSVEDKVEKAALLMYLNKTCFNGLYRVNRQGLFNVPWGRFERPRIYNSENLAEVRDTLNQEGIRILCRDYEAIRQEVKEGDFVYFDPPYHPLSETAHFTSYTSERFTWDDQEKLAGLFHKLAAKKCFIMLSNSPAVRRLYEGYGYQLDVVKAGRAINSVATRRGPIDELLVMNY
jgi:DNA adenine methylase